MPRQLRIDFPGAMHRRCWITNAPIYGLTPNSATNTRGAGGAVSDIFPKPLEAKTMVDDKPPTRISVVSNTGIAYNLLGQPVTNAPGEAGAETGFVIRVFPTNVPFSYLYFRELPGVATNVTGCFANTNCYTNSPNPNVPTNMANIGHTTAGHWVNTHNDNIYNDSIWSPPIYPPYSAGSFEWAISNIWTLNTNTGTQSNFVMTYETFSVDSNGTVTITKFGNHGVSRQTNGVTTNW
jgi:hypothetical protein